MEALYGPTETTFNVHLLLHMSDRFQDINRHAPLISSEQTACYVSRLLGGPHFIKNVLKIVRGGTTLVCLGRPKFSL